MEGECLSGETPGNGVMPEPSQVVPNTVPDSEPQSVLHACFLSPAHSQGLGLCMGGGSCGGSHGPPRHSAGLRLGEADGA